MDEAGNWVEGTGTATLVTDGEEAGAFDVTGTGGATVTFTVTAGTYTINSPTATYDRNTRILEITKTISAHKVAASEEDIVKLTGVELAATANVQVGKAVKLELTATPADAGYTAVWTSDSDKVTVDQKGNVTAAADAEVNSTATITVEVTDSLDPTITFTKTCTVTVIAAVTTKTYTYTVGATNDAAWTTTASTNSMDKNDANSKKGLQLKTSEPNKPLTLTANGSKITVTMEGFTTSGSGAMEVTLTLMNGTETVGTLTGTCPADKAYGAFTFTNSGVLELSGKTFTSIVITSTTSGKHLSITTATIIVE